VDCLGAQSTIKYSATAVTASRFWATLAVFSQSFGTKSRIDSGCQAIDTYKMFR